MYTRTSIRAAMDVSNSTGSGTDYRIMAGGAAP